MNENEIVNIFDIKEKKDNKKRIIGYLAYIIFVISLIILITLISILIKWQKDNKNTNSQIEEIYDIVKIEEITNNSESEYNNTQNINPPSNTRNDYWDYVNMPLINVDFNNLLKVNNDTVAWINVPNTNINYPVVQSNDNSFYLNHSYKKDYTDAGWIFMDYRNNNFTDKNTIVYGHSRLNKTMFGTLKNVITTNWYNNKENHIIKVSTPYFNYLYQVFSVYKIETESYYLQVNFENDNSYKNFLNAITNRSIFNFNCEPNEYDKIITLSTCSNNNKKIVLHAKLIKVQER